MTSDLEPLVGHDRVSWGCGRSTLGMVISDVPL